MPVEYIRPEYIGKIYRCGVCVKSWAGYPPVSRPAALPSHASTSSSVSNPASAAGNVTRTAASRLPHITSEHTLPSAFAVPGALACRVDGPRAVVSVRNVTPDLISELRSHWHANVEVEDLNLEDIFLELHQGTP